MLLQLPRRRADRLAMEMHVRFGGRAAALAEVARRAGGRDILPRRPAAMRALDAQERGAGGEIQLTDAMTKLIGTEPFHAYRFDGERHDCGSAAGFVIANLAVALKRDDVGPAVRAFVAGA